MKIKQIGILLILSLLFTSCSATASFNSRMEEGDNLIIGGQLDRAEDLFLEIIEEHGQESQPYLKLAHIYDIQGDSYKAIDILQKGLEKAEDKDPLNLKLGEIYLSSFELDKAKESLLKVNEKSSSLAVNLIKLAADSDDLDYFKKVYNEYKDEKLIQDSNEFFENAILAYAKFEDGQGIKKLVDQVETLNLKLDPLVLARSYSSLINLNMEDMANSIITKDIYDKEKGNLHNLSNLVKEEGNKKFINLTSGYFIDPNRLDIAILYGYEAGWSYYEELEIVIINGLNGETIASLKENTINAFMYIDNFDVSGNNEHILSLWGHAGGSGTPSSVSLYELRDKKLNKIRLEDNSDREITFKDNFEFEIKSEKLNIKYLLQLDLTQIPYYISEGLYKANGKILVKGNELGFGYEHADTIKNLGSSDYIVYTLGLTDTYDNKSYLGTVKSVFKYEDNRLDFKDLYVKGNSGEKLPFSYKEAEDYKEVDFKDYIPNKESLRDLLGFHLDLFNETEASLRAKYGSPIEEGWYEGRYIKYKNFIAFLLNDGADSPVVTVWTNDLLGVENNENLIIERFGSPDAKWIDDMWQDSHMDYYLGDVVISFVGLNNSVNLDFIEIRKREDLR